MDEAPRSTERRRIDDLDRELLRAQFERHRSNEVPLKEHIEEAAAERRKLSTARWEDHTGVHRAEHERLAKQLEGIVDKFEAADSNILRELAGYSTHHGDIHHNENRALETALAGVHRENEIHRNNHVHEHDLDQRAIDLAGKSVDSRLTSMNELRTQLNDQAAKFVRTDVLNELVAKLEQRAESNRIDVQHLREEAAARVGHKKGIDSTTAAIYAGMVLLVMILGIVITFAASRH